MYDSGVNVGGYIAMKGVSATGKAADFLGAIAHKLYYFCFISASFLYAKVFD